MKTVKVCGLIAGVCLLVSAVFAADGVGFKTTLCAGATLGKGNSEALQANGSLLTEGDGNGLSSMRAGIEANYGQSTVADVKSTTVENERLFGNFKLAVSDRFFGYVDGAVMKDQIAKVDYRVTAGPGFGVYVVKNSNTTLSAEVGPSYLWEDVNDTSDSRLVLRVGERLTHAFSATAKVWQSVEYLPQETQFANYLLSAEIGIEAALNAHLNLRLVLQDKYNSQPPAGLVNNDLTLIGGIGVKL